MPTKYQISVAVLALLFIAGGTFVYAMAYLGKANALKKYEGAANFATLSPLRDVRTDPPTTDSQQKNTDASIHNPSNIGSGSNKDNTVGSAGVKDKGDGDTDWPKGIPKTKINVNTASAELLEALPGIGPVIAKRIVEYREKNGFFANPENLIDVKGIGEKKLKQILPYIRVQ
jgi:competence ComEA-like helix-hairpin-helix protein